MISLILRGRIKREITRGQFLTFVISESIKIIIRYLHEIYIVVKIYSIIKKF